MVTGMLTQGPLDKVFERVGSKVLTPSEYVADLGRHLMRIHDGVAGYLPADYEQTWFRFD